MVLLLLLFAFSTVFAPLPNSPKHQVVVNALKFGIANDMFWKDGQPFRIIGGDLHYFRTLPLPDVQYYCRGRERGARFAPFL
ncbi:putative beta-galactosidase [Helianthus annuus]|uniref:Beta-galactosidase n=1 Tax=Helianthus annuus TaxID=4232 RepID=A0A9K3N490_HELAN|nr:putative beta-galactosidase [Helianthus annuus]KAJ0879273.1 putative beta-galactosidase [Helianthus annuus]